MATVSINAPGASGFLYDNSSGRARVVISAETPDFDDEVLRNWRDEGFDVMYVPYDGNVGELQNRLRNVKDHLGVGENYAVIAFGDAASVCLDYYLTPINASRLCALISYYPTRIPDTRTRYPPSVQFLTHLAGNSVGVTTRPTALGIQGKKKTTTRPINPGIGTGERLYIGHTAYTYEFAQPGFAEHDLDEYDQLAAELAWSRTVQTLRKAFTRHLDLEERWEQHLDAKFFSLNLSKTMDSYVNQLTPAVTYTPTLSGAIGKQALRRFYDQHFIHALPPSMQLRLISRTVGADRVVDELHVSFQHTQEIPWMLPGVPPTQKRVQIILVSIVSLRGGKLYSEHVYWDQASLLVQVGLLDPKLVPQNVQGVDRLPVIGRESAIRILEEDPEVEGQRYHNRLIRRARAKERGKGDVTPAPEESVTESIKGDDETPQENGKGIGQTSQQKLHQAESEKADDHSDAHENGDQPSTPKAYSASVEDTTDDE